MKNWEECSNCGSDDDGKRENQFTLDWRRVISHRAGCLGIASLVVSVFCDTA